MKIFPSVHHFVVSYDTKGPKSVDDSVDFHDFIKNVSTRCTF